MSKTIQKYAPTQNILVLSSEDGPSRFTVHSSHTVLYPGRVTLKNNIYRFICPADSSWFQQMGSLGKRVNLRCIPASLMQDCCRWVASLCQQPLSCFRLHVATLCSPGQSLPDLIFCPFWPGIEMTSQHNYLFFSCGQNTTWNI